MIVEADETFDVDPEVNALFLFPEDIWDNTDTWRSNMETYEIIIVMDDNGKELYRAEA